MTTPAEREQPEKLFVHGRRGIADAMSAAGCPIRAVSRPEARFNSSQTKTLLGPPWARADSPNPCFECRSIAPAGLDPIKLKLFRSAVQVQTHDDLVIPDTAFIQRVSQGKQPKVRHIPVHAARPE